MDNSVDKKKTWLAYFEKEYLREKGTVEHDITLIIKDMLLPNGSHEAAARTAAHQVDDYYWERNSGSDASFRFQHGDFYSLLDFLCHVIFEAATLLPYNDPRQDLLVQLVIELPKLPSRSIDGHSAKRLVSVNEPMFADTWNDVWSGKFASDKVESIPSSKWEKESRVIDDDNILDVGKYPSLDIPEGLEKDIPPGITRDSKVMVAAQYILIAGDFIEDRFVQKLKKEGDSWGVDKWQLWARKLEELAEKELTSEVKTAVIEARKKLVSLHPELFLISEGGSKPDQ